MAEARGFASKIRIRTLTLTGFNGGSERIRTSETVTRPHDFESCAFNHSATLPPIILPQTCKKYHTNLKNML